MQHVETLHYNIRLRGNRRNQKLCIPSLKGFQVIESKDIIYHLYLIPDYLSYIFVKIADLSDFWALE